MAPASRTAIATPATPRSRTSGARPAPVQSSASAIAMPATASGAPSGSRNRRPRAPKPSGPASGMAPASASRRSHQGSAFGGAAKTIRSTSPAPRWHGVAPGQQNTVTSVPGAPVRPPKNR